MHSVVLHQVQGAARQGLLLELLSLPLCFSLSGLSLNQCVLSVPVRCPLYLPLCCMLVCTDDRWAPHRSDLAPAAQAKAGQLGQKLSMGLEAAYQVSYYTAVV